MKLKTLFEGAKLDHEHRMNAQSAYDQMAHHSSTANNHRDLASHHRDNGNAAMAKQHDRLADKHDELSDEYAKLGDKHRSRMGTK